MQKADSMKSKIQVVTQKVDPAIYELLCTHVEQRCQNLAKYQISCGGKRLRPTLAFLSCELLGGKEEDVLYPAASLEILHNSTLIIDDIIDHSDTRRGNKTVWKKYGTSMAECFSMDYVASVFQGAMKSPKPKELTELFAKTLKTIVDGEVDDILFERSGRESEPFVQENRFENITEEDYHLMAEKKTAALIKASCETGGICAGGSASDVELLGEYGFNIGVAFQIRDDILDIFGDEKEFGKKIGKDIIEKKLGNIVVLFAIKELNAQEREELLSILNTSQAIQDSQVESAINLIKKTSANEKASKLAEEFVEKALMVLNKLPKNEANNTLAEIATFIVQRKN